MRVKVTGYIEISDDEYDDGPSGPLTEAAHVEYINGLGLDDTEVELADEDE